jgi:hypothetical protein
VTLPPSGSPLPPDAPPSRVVARRLLARELGGEARIAAAGAGEVAAAGERFIARLAGGLSRSFGPYGAVALISRALTRARAGNPVLATVTVTAASVAGSPGAPALIAGLATSAGEAGTAATAEALTVWLAQLADLLGGLIGDALTATILEQCAADATNGSASQDGMSTGTPGAVLGTLPGSPDKDAHTTVDER